MTVTLAEYKAEAGVKIIINLMSEPLNEVDTRNELFFVADDIIIWRFSITDYGAVLRNFEWKDKYIDDKWERVKVSVDTQQWYSRITEDGRCPGREDCDALIQTLTHYNAQFLYDFGDETTYKMMGDAWSAL